MPMVKFSDDVYQKQQKKTESSASVRLPITVETILSTTE